MSYSIINVSDDLLRIITCYAINLHCDAVQSATDLLCAHLIITSAKEVMFSSAFVCLLAGLHENYSDDFQKKIGGKVATAETIIFWW